MNRLAWFGWVILIVLLCVSAECCDKKHGAYEENAKSVEICKARGGVPVVDIVEDEGGHRFIVLVRCEGLLTLPLKGEK